MTESATATRRLLAEVLRDSHAYVPGIDHRRPTLVDDGAPRWRRGMRAAVERTRDSLERGAARIGFVHPHFDASDAGARLSRVVELREGLESTYELLDDEASRRAMIDVLKLRVLGPYHARLAVTPGEFREAQARIAQDWTIEHGTYVVSDPWFSPLSLFEVPVDGGRTIMLHAHSVDIVSVFVLGQYNYGQGASAITAEPGDVVLDIGGCWGDTALYFADLVGPRGRVYTFEFDPENLDILRANLALNPELASRIEIVERALWDRSGDVLEFTQAGRCTALANGRPGEKLRVPTVTVDEFVRQAGVDRVGFVKMDVEGSELNVLRGARRALEEFAPKLAIAAYHKDDDLVSIPRELSATDAGYRLYLGSFSPVEEETVLFAHATRRSSST